MFLYVICYTPLRTIVTFLFFIFLGAAGCYEPETLDCAIPVTEVSFEWDISCLLAQECRCSDNNDIAKYIFDIVPYLYPFSIEFSILIGEYEETISFASRFQLLFLAK